MRCLIAVAFVLVAACSGGMDSGIDDAALSPSVAYLTGSWVPQGGSCNSDEGVRFDADGQWSGPMEQGTWRLDGQQLVLVTTEVLDQDTGSELPPLPTEERRRIRVLGPDAFAHVAKDGHAVLLTRCSDQP